MTKIQYGVKPDIFEYAINHFCVVLRCGWCWLLLVVIGLDPHLDPPPPAMAHLGQFLLWPVPTLASSYFGQFYLGKSH